MVLHNMASDHVSRNAVQASGDKQEEDKPHSTSRASSCIATLSLLPHVAQAHALHPILHREAAIASTTTRAKIAPIYIHHARLYEKLLDSCDWSETLARQRGQRRRELLSQEQQQLAAAVAPRESELRQIEQVKQHTARAKMAALAKANREAREAQDWQCFARRQARFVARHEQLLGELRAQESAAAQEAQRSRARVYDLWEREVFLPIQNEVRAAVAHKCANDRRSYRADADGRKCASYSAQDTLNRYGLHDGWSSRSACPAYDGGVGKGHLSSSQENSKEGFHSLHHTNSQSGREDKNNISTSNRKSMSRKEMQWDAGRNDTLQCAREASWPTRWKERKDELWRSFLHQCNITSRVGRGNGVFLHVINEAEYDPVGQCEAETIRYAHRTPCMSVTDAEAKAATGVIRDYNALALSYHDVPATSRAGDSTQRHRILHMPNAVADKTLRPIRRDGRNTVKSMRATMTANSKRGCSAAEVWNVPRCSPRKGTQDDTNVLAFAHFSLDETENTRHAKSKKRNKLCTNATHSVKPDSTKERSVLATIVNKNMPLDSSLPCTSVPLSFLGRGSWTAESELSRNGTVARTLAASHVC